MHLRLRRLPLRLPLPEQRFKHERKSVGSSFFSFAVLYSLANKTIWGRMKECINGFC